MESDVLVLLNLHLIIFFRYFCNDCHLISFNYLFTLYLLYNLNIKIWLKHFKTFISTKSFQKTILQFLALSLFNFFFYTLANLWNFFFLWISKAFWTENYNIKKN